MVSAHPEWLGFACHAKSGCTAGGASEMQTGDSRGAETMSRRLPVGHLIRPSGTDTLQLEPATSSARPNSADRRLISASVEPVDLGAASWPGYGPPPVVELATEATRSSSRQWRLLRLVAMPVSLAHRRQLSSWAEPPTSGRQLLVATAARSRSDSDSMHITEVTCSV